MRLRPRLRHVYAASYSDAGPRIMRSLGFVAWNGASLESVSEVTSGYLDMGRDSVEGWLSRLLEEELGDSGHELLDPDARQLCLPSGRVDLTQLEAGLLAELLAARGRVVSTAELLTKVWGHGPDASTSNVVQAVVRTLRKKLGPYSARLVTVRGAGYKLEG